MTTPHQMLNPPTLPAPVGFTHVVAPAEGRVVYLAGQAGHRPDGSIGEGLLDQFEQACRNVVAGVEAGGGGTEHLVSMQVFVTDLAAYRKALGPIGQAYRRVLGRHYPAISVFEVSGLFDPAAIVELVCVAIVPRGEAGRGAPPSR